MKKEGRIARDLRTVQEISRDPRSILPRVRGWLVELWALRGGGFYGLGYIVAFVALEIATLTGDFGSSASVSGFFEAQILQYLARVSVQSMINTVLALLWPIYLLRWWGWYGIAMLVIGSGIFELAIRPRVEAWLPELKEARLKIRLAREEKRNRKRQKRAGRSDP